MKHFRLLKKRTESQTAAKPAAEQKPVKVPKVEGLLLQTYFTSLLCLVLCVTMFFGTSYAWFTSEVSNTTNEIYVGTLKVGLQAGEGSGWSLTDADNKLFNQNIRWEPGFTTLDTLHVTNEGDLAFRYELSFTDGSLSDSQLADVASAAENFEIWYFDHQKHGVPEPSSYADITEGNNWQFAGNLAELLAGKVVLTGQIEKGLGMEEAIEVEEASHTYTVALHMIEGANADIMGSRISLNVKLVAYQMVSEMDVMDNANYDDVAAVSDVQTLKTALETNTHVLMSSEILLDDSSAPLMMYSETLDGGNNAIVYNGGAADVLTTAGGKISNLYIHGGNSCALYSEGLNVDLVVTDCALSGAYSFKLDSAARVDNAILSFRNTSFTDPVVYSNAVSHTYFTGCTFDDVLMPSGETTLTDCAFTAESLDASNLEAGETVTLINCSYNGQLVEKAVLVSNGETVILSGTDVLQVTADNLVVRG